MQRQSIKPAISRRAFVAGAAACGLMLTQETWAKEESAYDLVAGVDRARILRQAEKWVAEKPVTITSFKAERSPGTLHDYFSEADYFWPNPANPSGPYKEIDGKSNPDNFQEHRKAMIRLSLAMPALAAGYRLAGKQAYGKAAAAHLKAWFVTPETHMNPNLELSQGVRNGGPTGRSYGIIDTLHLAEVARGAGFVKSFLSAEEWAGVQGWFREYLAWMKTSDKGGKERDATNNHSICWSLQASEFARLAGDDATRAEVKQRFETVQLPMQMGQDGSFPRETARTKPYGYSIFNFDAAAVLCWSLGGETEVRFALPDGRGMCRAASWLAPYIADKTQWPFPHDVQHWESWPVRSLGLLFCGVACHNDDYLALWRRLDPDPIDPEIIRNYPIRQPVLWV